MQPLPTPRPLVLWIHGGGSATPKISTPAIALVNPGGVSVASIEYRSGTGVSLQMQLADAKAAVRWLRANASKYEPGASGDRRRGPMKSGGLNPVD